MTIYLKRREDVELVTEHFAPLIEKVERIY